MRMLQRKGNKTGGEERNENTAKDGRGRVGEDINKNTVMTGGIMSLRERE